MKTFQEFLEEALAASLIKSVARSIMRRQGLRTIANRARIINNTNPPIRSKPIKLKPPITGFRTSRGSTYSFEMKPKSLAKTQRTAAVDPHHPTTPGPKQRSDWTVFMKPDNAIAASNLRLRYGKGINDVPMQKTPSVGMAPLEVWNSYAEKGGRFASHPGSPITNVYSGHSGQIKPKLSPNSREELRQRLAAGLKRPQNIEGLKKEIKSALERRRISNSQQPN